MPGLMRIMLLWVSPIIFGLIVAGVALTVFETSLPVAALILVIGIVFDHGLHRALFASQLKQD